MTGHGPVASVRAWRVQRAFWARLRIRRGAYESPSPGSPATPCVHPCEMAEPPSRRRMEAEARHLEEAAHARAVAENLLELSIK